jgi:hypothetical protein
VGAEEDDGHGGRPPMQSHASTRGNRPSRTAPLRRRYVAHFLCGGSKQHAADEDSPDAPRTAAPQTTSWTGASAGAAPDKASRGSASQSLAAVELSFYARSAATWVSLAKWTLAAAVAYEVIAGLPTDLYLNGSEWTYREFAWPPLMPPEWSLFAYALGLRVGAIIPCLLLALWAAARTRPATTLLSPVTNDAGTATASVARQGAIHGRQRVPRPRPRVMAAAVFGAFLSQVVLQWVADDQSVSVPHAYVVLLLNLSLIPLTLRVLTTAGIVAAWVAALCLNSAVAPETNPWPLAIASILHTVLFLAAEIVPALEREHAARLNHLRRLRLRWLGLAVEAEAREQAGFLHGILPPGLPERAVVALARLDAGDDDDDEGGASDRRPAPRSLLPSRAGMRAQALPCGCCALADAHVRSPARGARQRHSGALARQQREELLSALPHVPLLRIPSDLAAELPPAFQRIAAAPPLLDAFPACSPIAVACVTLHGLGALLARAQSAAAAGSAVRRRPAAAGAAAGDGATDGADSVGSEAGLLDAAGAIAAWDALVDRALREAQEQLDAAAEEAAAADGGSQLLAAGSSGALFGAAATPAYLPLTADAYPANAGELDEGRRGRGLLAALKPRALLAALGRGGSGYDDADSGDDTEAAAAEAQTRRARQASAPRVVLWKAEGPASYACFSGAGSAPADAGAVGGANRGAVGVSVSSCAASLSASVLLVAFPSASGHRTATYATRGSHMNTAAACVASCRRLAALVAAELSISAGALAHGLDASTATAALAVQISVASGPGYMAVVGSDNPRCCVLGPVMAQLAETVAAGAPATHSGAGAAARARAGVPAGAIAPSPGQLSALAAVAPHSNRVAISLCPATTAALARG